MRTIDVRPRFKADVQLKNRQDVAVDLETLHFVLEELAAGHDVPDMLNPHPLSREWAGFHEFHLDNDLLVIYKITDTRVEFHRLGTHRDLFLSKRR